MSLYPAHAHISHAALASNYAALAARTDAEILAVVKADGYGHGGPEVARTFLAAGATYLGVAQLAEAFTLRAAGITAPILAWIFLPDVALLTRAFCENITISVGAGHQIEAVAAAAHAALDAGHTPRVHVAVNTGMAREGFDAEDISTAVARLRAAGVEIEGIWSHLARADEVGHDVVRRQRMFFEAARAEAESTGEIRLPHLAASSGLLWHPETHYAMVRPGISLYGYSPNSEIESSEKIGLTPAMSVRARLLTVREIGAGVGVSYGHTYESPEGETLGVVPLGYGDGIPRAASNRASVLCGGVRCPVRGRICMDQFMVEVPAGIGAGETVEVFGSTPGAPTAEEWAHECGTISYEITTRLGARVPRVHEENS